MAVVSGFGAYLRKKREERGVSLEELAERTKIQLRYLEAIEAGHFHLLPGPAYVRGFLRLYASSVGLAPEAVVGMFGETDAAKNLSNPASEKSEEKAPRRREQGGPVHRVGELVALVVLLTLLGAVATWASIRVGM